MGIRLRFAIGTALLGVLVLAIPAGAEEFSACWVIRTFNPVTLVQQQITRCRIAGGDIVDYASDSSVPGKLFPLPGTDTTGPCWYYSSTDGNWLFAQLYSNGDAVLGYTTSGLGGFAIVTGRIPRCTSEPTPSPQPIAEVWSYVTDYIHPPPQPALSPPEGDGVTGLATFAQVTIPDPHTAQLVGGAGELLDVEIEVSGVTIDWGDQTTDSYPADPEALSGYPDGIASHIYQTKSETIVIDVSYHWFARWRVDGGPWQDIAAPDTSAATPYPIAEIVSVITG